MKLTNADFYTVALEQGMDVAALKAFYEVEVRGAGHLPDGRPKILFEGHKFYHHLGQTEAGRRARSRAIQQRPDLCFLKWTRAHYKGGAAEWDRLAAAIEFHREAALMSASWGSFQIMGENFRACGYQTVQDFVNAMYQGGRAELVAVCKFIKSKPLLYKALQVKNWDRVAYYYNGPLYAENLYHIKLAKAYVKHSKIQNVTA